MATWSTPITWTSAVVTVPQMNQQVRDNSQFLYDERTPPTVITITTTGTQAALGIPSGKGPLVILANNATDLILQGITAPGVNGQTLTIMSIGAGKVLFEHQHGSASANNRLINFATVGQTPLAAGSGVAMYGYDGTAARWRLQQHEQGAWITPAFAAGDYTGGGTQTWTVASGDVGTCRSCLEGRKLTLQLSILTTTVGGTPHTDLRRVIPGGFVSAAAGTTPIRVIDSGTAAFGLAVVGVASSTITFFVNASGASNWSAATDTTGVVGTFTFEVQ